MLVAHSLQATIISEELSLLNPLTKLRRLHIEAHPADPRLDWLSLGHDVMVMTPCLRLYRQTVTCNRADKA